MTRSRVRPPLSRARPWSLVLGALAAGSLGSCDNPACVFAPNGCQTLPEGGANAASATFPATGEWVVPNQPRVDRVFPAGTASPESPIVVVFSESISPASIQGAFEVRPAGGLGGGAGGQVSAKLVGDGRVLVLIPAALIGGASYEIAFTDDAKVRDLSGALVLKPQSGVLGSFTVSSATGAEPQLLMSWPLDGATQASTISEIVTVFDRVIDPESVTASSWHVLVDGLAPTFDSLPSLLALAGPGGQTIQESRVWTWKSLDTASGARAELGTDATVTVELSTSLTKIRTPEGDALQAVTPSFTTFAASPPSALAIISEPSDAIGIENLNGVNPLMVQVDLPAPALEGDVLEIFLVGNNPPDPVDPGSEAELLSRQREFALTDGVSTFVLQEAELILLTSSIPLRTHFEDGPVAFGFAVRRGAERTALRVLDVDSDEDDVQDPVQDLVPPTFVRLLGMQAGENIVLSDLRELSVSGVASEDPRTVEVVVNLSGGAVDNRVGGNLPPLPSSSGDGEFVAAPVNLGPLDLAEQSVSVGVIVYDDALNASAPFMLEYTQRGVGGFGTSLPGSGLDVQVSVFNSVTLAPVAGARVFSHESVAGILSTFTTMPVFTNAAGFAQIESAPTGETLITVEAAGYDLFTFQAVPTTRLDVSLVPDLINLAAAALTVSAPGSSLASSFIENWAADSRVLLPGETVREASDATFVPFFNATTIGFNPPVAVRPNELGAVTFLATKQPSDLSDPTAFSAGTFLQAFELLFPRPPVTPSEVDVGVIVVDQLLSGAEVDPADVPLGTAQHALLKPPNYDLDFPNPSGGPRVSVEAFTPGAHGMITIGLGLAYFNAFANAWDIRAAYTARARAAGELATALTIEDERYLRVEVVDSSGNRSGVRQALSTSVGTLTPPAVSILSAPSGTTAGDAYDLVHSNVITGTQDTKGLYRVLLVDSLGKRWHLWILDPPFSAGAVVQHVPPIAMQGGVPLSSGAITSFIDVWSWPSFNASSFMFSDIALRHDRFSTASAKVFSQL